MDVVPIGNRALHMCLCIVDFFETLIPILLTCTAYLCHSSGPWMDPCKYTGNRFQFADKYLHYDRVLRNMGFLNTVKRAM